MISCSMNSGWPSSTTSTARLPAQKSRISSGASGQVTFSTSIDRSLPPNASASPSCCSARTTEL